MVEWDMQGIKELMDKMAETGLGELRLKDGEFELRLSAKQPVAAPMYTVPAATPATVAEGIASAPPAGETALKAETALTGNVVKSPIVGTFYASPAPDKPAFVQVGSQVKKGDVLFVIESMKLMNEIQSEYSGEITEILVENSQGVEYNQPILVIK